MVQSNNVVEESLLAAIDQAEAEQHNQGTKAFLNMFKSVILEKYKDDYYQELRQSRVHKRNLEKATDYFFEVTCARYRLLPGIPDENKEAEISMAKSQLPAIKAFAESVLKNNGIVVVE